MAGISGTGLLHEVVGVSRDVQSVRHMQDDGPFFYGPLDLAQAKPQAMLIRVAGDPAAAAAAIRGIVRQLDPQMAASVATLGALVERQAERLRPVALYSAMAATLALLLALTGVYGVVSFSVSQRVRELAIRVAPGAQRRDIITLVVRSAVTPILGGLLAGVGLTVAAGGGMRAMLYGLDPRDPVTITIGALLLVGCALAAIWIPARRAATRDPLSALR